MTTLVVARRPGIKFETNAWLFGLLLAGLVFIAYARVWHAGFIWDDESHLTENPVIVGPLGLREIWLSAHAVYYPLVLTTFWFLHKLVSLAPLPYHVLNVLLHACNALLLWRLLRKLETPGAWLGAAVWALHPIMVQSVAWVTELKNTQSCFFYLSSILCFLEAEDQVSAKPRRSGLISLALLCFVMAIASKPSTIMLPVVLVLCLWWRNHRWRLHDVVVLVPFFLISAAAGAWTIWEQKFHAGAIGPEWSQTWPARLIIAGRAVWFYLFKLLWPKPLIFIYPRWQITTSQTTAYLPSLAAVVALLLLWQKRNTWMRPVTFAAAYFVISLFPVLGFFSVYFFRYSFVSDHFQYLASIGPLALIGSAVAKGFDELKCPPIVRGAGYGLLLLVLSSLSWHQTGDYIDVVTLYNNTLAKNPSCWMAHYNLGIALLAKGESDQAIDHYRKAIALWPDYAEAHYNLARLLAEKRNFDEAISHYEKALAINPDDAETYNNLGVTLSQMDRRDEAISDYRKALSIRPDYPDASSNLAHALFREGRNEEAIDCYGRALQLRPDDSALRTDLGNILVSSGRPQDAIAQYRRALAFAPQNVSAQSNLSWLLATSSDPSLRNGVEAVRLAENANRLSSDKPVILRILAAAYAENGNFTAASQSAERALELANIQGDLGLTDLLRKELSLYRAGSPYRRTSELK